CARKPVGRRGPSVPARSGATPSHGEPHGIRPHPLVVDPPDGRPGIEDVSRPPLRAVAPHPEAASRVRDAETDRIVLRAAAREATHAEADVSPRMRAPTPRGAREALSRTGGRRRARWR